MLSFAHIINAVNAPAGTELHRVQPIVFRSMEVAQAQATEAKVQLLAVCYEEDAAVVPPYFNLLPFLSRSILDVMPQANTKRLPFIMDILQALQQNTAAEYLIYTNADIILQPYFYQTVAAYIQQGHDALIINRRRIAPQYNSPEQLPQIWAEMGNPHPGFDCFVIHRSLLQKFILGNIIVGTPFIEATLAYNVFAFSQNYLLLHHHHLTAHLGMEVMPKRNKELYWHNRNEFFNTILPVLKPYLSAQKLPYGQYGWFGKHLKRALNPAIFTGLGIELAAKNRWERLRWYANEIRWAIVGKK